MLKFVPPSLGKTKKCESISKSGYFFFVVSTRGVLEILQETNCRTSLQQRSKPGRRIAEHSMTGTNDVLTNIKVVRAFATEKEETAKFSHLSKLQSILQQRTDVATKSAIFFFIFLLCANMGYVMYVCAEKVSAGEMKGEDVAVTGINIGIHLLFRFQSLFDMVPPCVVPNSKLASVYRMSCFLVPLLNLEVCISAV